MILENYPDNFINKKLREQVDAEEATHKPSGKLTASMLGQPLQWQILKVIGIGKKEVDDYLLRKFARGKSVEDWIVGLLPNVVETQKEVEYRGTIGLVDAVMDTSSFEHNLGIIPYEIKSVANSKYKWLKKRGEADPMHKLQGTLYALAMGASHYSIMYVASDDYRILNFTYPVLDTKDEVEQIITQFQEALAKQSIPAFVAKYDWQAKPEYNQYPDWLPLTEEECNFALKYHFPTAWEEYTKRMETKK